MKIKLKGDQFLYKNMLKEKRKRINNIYKDDDTT
jgi:hypothetical protein